MPCRRTKNESDSMVAPIRFARRLLAVLPLLSSIALPVPAAPAERDHLDLDGRWEFRLDAGAAGLAQKWYAGAVRFSDAITVPGAWQAEGFGSPAGNLRHQYEGTAWYRRKVSVPASWLGKAILLRIDGAHRRATVFVNGIEMGGHDGFSAPFEMDVTSAIRPGAENDIVLRIENPHVSIEASPDKQEPLFPTGMLNYIGNWGGIYGDVTLEAVPRTRVETVAVAPDVEHRRVSFRIRIRSEAQAARISVRVNVTGSDTVTATVSRWDGEYGEAVVEVPVPNAPLWSPEEPRLLVATVRVLLGGNELDRFEQRFGLRQVSTRGHALLLNGKPLYLRAYGDDNVEVITGFPAPSRAVITQRLKLAKSFGFNAVRFHSMVPPAAYFDAADEAGMLVMAELPAAYTQYFFAHRDFLKRELRNVLLAHRNHPSLLSLAFGNEFNLRWLKSDADRHTFLQSIAEFYSEAKQMAPATLILSNDGFDMRPTDMVSTGRNPPDDRPAVRHEFGAYYCSLPDISLIQRFTGVINPAWLEVKKRWVAAEGMEATYAEYVRNSQRLQQLGRKYQIERARADGRFTGYDYWLIVDYPGGTGEGDSWEEGWFDYFWKPKGITPEEGAELNSPVLLMIGSDVGDRSLWLGEQKRVPVLVSNYAPESIRNGRLSWEVWDGTRRLEASELTGISADLGAVSRVGEVTVNAGGAKTAGKLELRLRLITEHGSYSNRWNFWAYPQPDLMRTPVDVIATAGLAGLAKIYPWVGTDTEKLTSTGLLVTERLDSTALMHLRSGGRVWLMLSHSQGQRGAAFFPASGGALGTIVRHHPALQNFPHEGFCDLQFYNLMNGASPLPMDGWPREIEPIIGAVRTTSEFLSKTKQLSRTAYAVEAKTGGGRLLMTTFNLRNFATPEGISLVDSLLRYAASDAFQPQGTLPDGLLQRIAAE